MPWGVGVTMKLWRERERRGEGRGREKGGKVSFLVTLGSCYVCLSSVTSDDPLARRNYNDPVSYS